MTDRRVEPLVNEIKAMKERMDALFMKSFGGREKETPESESGSAWRPTVDVVETEGQWWFIVDLPGVREDDLRLEVVDNTLRISGNKPADVEGLLLEDVTPRSVKRERDHGPFSRVLRIPPDAREDAIQAELKHGVLRVMVPKRNAAPVSQHKITVHSL